MSTPRPPADYNAITITVTPEDLLTAATTASAAIVRIVHSLSDINGTLGELQLGWAGDTAKKAQEFSDQWSACMTEMFGRKDHAADGILNRLVDALAGARGNYDATESFIADKLFGPLTTALTSAPVPGAAPRPDETGKDPALTAVSETFRCAPPPPERPPRG
ncbi:WXG100 family type VII secretion target, partial [Streptomyces sp. H39-S7]|uniref:WXG100 family type VII secretion target n=1 Tax=Streptomyces sp. H39-S7 TaxID=3004357 RepID=UPI0022AF2631